MAGKMISPGEEIIIIIINNNNTNCCDVQCSSDTDFISFVYKELVSEFFGVVRLR